MQQVFNGELYTIVSVNQLADMINSGNDLTNIVTSKVSDMSGLFIGDL